MVKPQNGLQMLSLLNGILRTIGKSFSMKRPLAAFGESEGKAALQVACAAAGIIAQKKARYLTRRLVLIFLQKPV